MKNCRILTRNQERLKSLAIMSTDSEDAWRLHFRVILEEFIERKISTMYILVFIFSYVNRKRYFQQFHNI